MNRISTALILAFLAYAPATLAAAPADISAGRTRSEACKNCHGADGNVADDTMPRLAGQVPQYLEKQLRDFRSSRRKDCGSVGPGKPALSDRDIADLAAYFASQPVAAKTARQQVSALGENIYLKGRRSPTFMPACVGCHGAAGSGKANWQQVMTVAPAILPSSIGGQSQHYIAHELKAFGTGSRSNDEGKIMRNLAINLSEEEIIAVATYVANLKQ
ncbi:MAG: c-type cytochrome [Sulfuritalea sp.]|nr:c-type cytochrome [Sulfuritalea sp.]MDP1983806.1 c-type cytochrome [Sulfuritalea sp.]